MPADVFHAVTCAAAPHMHNGSASNAGDSRSGRSRPLLLNLPSSPDNSCQSTDRLCWYVLDMVSGPVA
jgi:hypothetical protein